MSKLKINGKRLLTLGFIPVLAITMTSCSQNKLDALDTNANYLTVGNYSVTTGEVWNNLKWDASSLFTEYKEEVVLQDKISQIKEVLADKNNENYEDYVSSLQNYIIEDVYDFTYSTEGHEDEIADLLPATREQNIKEYADTTYVNYRVDMTRDAICTALRDENYDALEPLYYIYYHDLASRLFAEDKLNKEIEETNAKADGEDNVGYFSKSDIVNKYEENYYNQGDIDIIMIRFSSEDEMNNTLRSFGIYVHDEKFYYLTDTPVSYTEYVQYYEDFDFEDANTNEYFDLDASYGHSIMLQLYIAMYNYIYSYREAIPNIKENESSLFENNNIIDQRSVTKDLIDFYNTNNLVYDADSDNARLAQIVDGAKSESNEYITYTAEELNDLNTSIYTYAYETLQTPTENVLYDNTNNRYSNTNSVYADGNYQYMIFKINQNLTDNDVRRVDGDNTYYYNLDLSTNEKYNLLTQDTYANLLADIKADLFTEDLTESYITDYLNEELAKVEVNIYDQAIEISYSVNNSDYNKTLGKAPNNNTVAKFKYNDRTLNANLTNAEKTGLWDILEYRNGITAAANIIANKMAKDTEEYKNIPSEIVDNFYSTIEYLLATFANDGLSSSGYPASIGKYNFLMLYYHTANVDDIVNNVMKVSYVNQIVLTDYSSDEVINFFNNFTTKAYDNYFNITAQRLSVYLDINEDTEPDEIENWQNDTVQFNGKTTTYGNVAKELINTIYALIESSSESHVDALTAIVEDYNSASRYNPHEGNRFDEEDGYYDPIGSEWDFSAFKKLGFAISTEELSVTNSSTDVDVALKDGLYNIYNSPDFVLDLNGNYNYPNAYLPDVEESCVEALDSYNYFVVTAASGPTSAKYEASDDTLSLYENLYYIYNEQLIKIDNVYNSNDTLNYNQIKAYLLEYLESQTSNLLPSDISDSITNYLSPVLTRFQESGTQYLIIINYICNGDLTKLTYGELSSYDNTRLEEILTINKDAADEYVDYGDNADKYDNFYGWWDDLSTLLSGGNN